MRHSMEIRSETARCFGMDYGKAFSRAAVSSAPRNDGVHGQTVDFWRREPPMGSVCAFFCRKMTVCPGGSSFWVGKGRYRRHFEEKCAPK